MILDWANLPKSFFLFSFWELNLKVSSSSVGECEWNMLQGGAEKKISWQTRLWRTNPSGNYHPSPSGQEKEAARMKSFAVGTIRRWSHKMWIWAIVRGVKYVCSEHFIYHVYRRWMAIWTQRVHGSHLRQKNNKMKRGKRRGQCEWGDEVKRVKESAIYL